MDRENLYRGKRFDNGKWIYGFYFNDVDKRFGIEIERAIIIGFDEFDDIMNNVEVDKDTVGQFTGKTDKNGNKIFEGDIVEYEFDEIGKQKAIIYWNFDYAGFLLNPLDNFQFTRTEDGRVIGNIYDNPELLGGKNG